MASSELEDYLNAVFPQIQDRYDILKLEPMFVEMLWKTKPTDLRPGNTLSGPTLFTLADCSFYAITLAMIGKKALAVTTNLSINFMRKSQLCDLIARTRILKLGSHLSVGNALIYGCNDLQSPLAQATITYSLPPQRLS